MGLDSFADQTYFRLVQGAELLVYVSVLVALAPVAWIPRGVRFSRFWGRGKRGKGENKRVGGREKCGFWFLVLRLVSPCRAVRAR